MPQQVKLKTKRVAREQPTQEQEDSSRQTAVDLVLQAIAEGEFDTHLDVIFTAVDARIAQYMEENPQDALPTLKDRQERFRTLRREPPQLVAGKKYRLAGEKYEGVSVSYLGMMERSDGDGGAAKAKVEIITGNSTVQPGKVYKVPVSALEDIPEMHKPLMAAKFGPTRPGPMCRKCGDPVDYSGKGRPSALCANCKNS